MRRSRGDDGAVLVEFAIVLPFLFLIVFGIIEFGWGFGQYLDVRHGAREGARLAAVNYSDPTVSPPSAGVTQTQEILEEVCTRMGGEVDGATLTLEFDVATDNELGDRATIVLAHNLETLTGFLDPFLEGRAVDDEVSFRLEQDATWTGGSHTCT